MKISESLKSTMAGAMILGALLAVSACNRGSDAPPTTSDRDVQSQPGAEGSTGSTGEEAPGSTDPGASDSGTGSEGYQGGSGSESTDTQQTQ